MAKLVQCVPNFSEGRRMDVVKEIADAIGSVSEIKVVDYSGDVDHNRSVITFVGPPGAVREAMLAGARAAVEKIDMRKHFGGHPRIGAIDVVPVVPLTDITMEECIALSKDIGRDFAEKLGIPVYFYAESASVSHRTNLPSVRKGGFERLRDAELTGDTAPDLGPSKIHPTAGASAVGARGPLIAFNVNLDSDNFDAACEIAKKIRQVRETGVLIGVQAIGVQLESRGIVQVSTNITRPHQTSMFEVYDFIEKEAEKHGIKVLESELIGAIRQDALLDTARQSLKLPALTNARVLDSWF